MIKDCTQWSCNFCVSTNNYNHKSCSIMHLFSVKVYALCAQIHRIKFPTSLYSFCCSCTWLHQWWIWFFDSLFCRIFSHIEIASFSWLLFVPVPPESRIRAARTHHPAALAGITCWPCQFLWPFRESSGQLLLLGHGKNLRKDHNSDRQAQTTVKTCLSVAPYPG